MIKFKNMVFLILLLMFVPINVFAANNHILTTESLVIDGSTITIEGYSYISHQDNYGGAKGNIKTYIVAYSGSDSNFNDTYLKIDKTNKEVTCKDGKACYIKETTVVPRDHWWARCTNTKCWKASQDAAKKRADNQKFINDSSCSAETACLYYNIGFSVTVSLKDIVRKFIGRDLGELESYDNNINFRIVTVNTDISFNNKTGGVGIVSSNLNPNSTVCKYKNSVGKEVSCGSDSFTSGIYEYSVKSEPTTIKIDASLLGIRVPNSAGKLVKPAELDPEGKLYYFEEGKEYKIFSGSSKPSIVKQTLTKKACKRADNCSEYQEGDYTDTYYRVDAYPVTAEVTGGAGYAYPNDGTVDTSSYSYWLGATHGLVDGNFQIDSIKALVDKYDCENVYLPNNTKKIEENDSDKNIGNNVIKKFQADCNNQKEGFVQGCKKSENFNGNIYVSVDEETLKECGGVIDNVVKTSSGSFQTLNFNVDILLYHRATLRFNKILDDNLSIRAGKGFSINSDEESSNTIFSTSAATVFYVAKGEWIYSDWKKSVAGSSSPFFTLKNGYVYYDGNRCVKTYEIDETETYYYKTDSNYIGGSLNNALLGAVNGALQLGKRNVGKDVLNASTSKLQLASCDSNYNGTTCSKNNQLVKIPGRWEPIYSKTNDRSIVLNNNEKITIYEGAPDGTILAGGAEWYEYSYHLPNAYISLADNQVLKGVTYNYGDVYYTFDNMKNTTGNWLGLGNKYFVNYKYSTEYSSDWDFPVELSSGNPSIYSEFDDWEVSGVCGVNVEDGYYTSDGADGSTLKYKYRSINLKNPFPKAGALGKGIASNWYDWYYNNVSNQNRIKSTLADLNNYDYTITVHKNGGTPSVSDIVNCSSSGKCSDGYGSLSNFSNRIDGTGRFVGYFMSGGRVIYGNNTTEGNFCPLGFFSENCNKVVS